MSKRKCFCFSCDGKLRAVNTVKRHRSLCTAGIKVETTSDDEDNFSRQGIVRDIDSASSVNYQESFQGYSPEEEFKETVKLKGCEGSGKRDSTCTLEEESTGAVVLREKVESSCNEDSDNSSAQDEDIGCEGRSRVIQDSSSEEEFSGKVVLKEKVESSYSEDSEVEDIGIVETSNNDVCENKTVKDPDYSESQSKSSGRRLPEATQDEEKHYNFSLVRWICHILIKLKLSYNCSNSLFSMIISIIYLILAWIKHPLHLFFPKTLNDLMLISNLRVFNECELMAVCPNIKCNAIYKLSEITAQRRNGVVSPALCKNKLFGKTCQAELAFSESLSFGRKKLLPFKKFPFLPPSKWIKLFFTNKEFLSLLEQRPEPSQDGSIGDMWDGRILKKFFRDPNNQERPLLEDKRNLALLLYLDFFNPFTRAIHSSGVLCMTILNLPRCVRYQKKWAMLVGIIPGPEEAQRHINSFLKPVVDDLLLLYKGINIQVRGVDGHACNFITRSILLPVLGDIPASRKMSQFLSYKANKPCDKCHQTAKREPGTVGASGRMSFLTTSMAKKRTDREVRDAMAKYNSARSKHSADEVAKVSGVRYSELSRLPYFHTVNNFLVDPMHNLFLGLVEDIGNAIIVGDEKFISANGRGAFQERMNKMQVPYDVGRLPRTMLEKMSGRGLTAQQWKNFIITFARVCLWNEVSQDAYRMVCSLAEACEIVLRDPISQADIDHLNKLLIDHHQLYAKIFGEFSVSINYHMVLHLPDQILNWGPPTAWWCFPYERRIGELSDTLTSGKSVEEQIFNHFFLQHCADHLPMPVLPDVLNKQIPAAITPLLETPSDCATESHHASSLGRAAEDFFIGKVTSTYTPKLIAGDPFQLVENEEFSTSSWPVTMLPPKRLNKRVQLSFLKDLKTYFRNLYHDAFFLVEPRIDIFARCNVNGTTFSSQFNRTERGSTILAYYVNCDLHGNETASPYFAKVTFFFKVRVHISSDAGIVKLKTHNLAYVEWYRFANRNHSVDKPSGLHALSGLFYKGNNLLNVRRLIRRVVLTQVRRNYHLVASISK